MDADKLHTEIDELMQLVVWEGAKTAGAFATLHGLHPTDVEALARVLIAERRGELLTAGQLGAELGLTSGAVTFAVDRLERAGHLARVPDPSDRRKVRLQYSPAGRALADEFFDPVRSEAEGVMGEFSAQELQVVERFLAASVAAMAARRRSS